MVLVHNFLDVEVPNILPTNEQEKLLAEESCYGSEGK